MRSFTLVLLFIMLPFIGCRHESDNKIGGKNYRRIISFAPSITETLFALSLGENVIGVTDFCDYPPEN